MKKVENDTLDEFGTSPNPFMEEPQQPGEPTNHIGLYQKCLNCQDYGVTCNGPKLAALGDIMVVREFHRAIKAARKITLKDIAAAATSISEYTVNDYFSHSVKDFKWTTVGVIDNALTAICGNRVGQPLLDRPCPASSSEISTQIDALRDQLTAAQEECERLRRKNTEKDEQYIEQMALQRNQHIKESEVRERSIAFLRTLSERQQKDLDEEKSQSADYLKRIDEKNEEIRRLQVKNSVLTFFQVLTLLALTCYLVWDIMHPGVGLFQW